MDWSLVSKLYSEKNGAGVVVIVGSSVDGVYYLILTSSYKKLFNSSCYPPWNVSVICIVDKIKQPQLQLFDHIEQKNDHIE